MSYLSEKLGLADVRFHDYYRSVAAGNYTFSTDWSQYPGMPTIFPGETWVLENCIELIRASNTKWHYSIYISIVYVISTFALKGAMSFREKGFDLKRELVLWNWLLALFSFVGTVRCWPEFLHVITTRGFTASYTENTYVEVGLR